MTDERQRASTSWPPSIANMKNERHLASMSWPGEGAKRLFAPEVPAIHVLLSGMMSGGFIYIMSNRRNGTLYVGVTSDLVRRCYEHRKQFATRFHETIWLEEARSILNGTMISALQFSVRRRSNIGHGHGRCD